MDKLGKKAGNFAKKNLQSVENRKRKLSTRQNEHPEIEDGEENKKEQQKKRCQEQEPGDIALDEVFGKDDDEILCSDSDGYLSEESGIASDILNPKLLSASAFSCICDLVNEQQSVGSVQALISLLNWYRAACHYGHVPSGITKPGIDYDIDDSETVAKVLTYVLQKADSTFSNILGISGSSHKEKILKLKNSPKWDTLKPLIKSFLRSTMHLVKQGTDLEKTVFALTQLRDSIVSFAAFPDLLQKFIKTAVHLWETSEGALLEQVFFILRDISMVSNSEYFDTCFISMYKAFLRNENILKVTSDQSMLYHRDSLVELCCQNVKKAYSKASVSITQLHKLLKMVLSTKNKEAVEKMYRGEYASCVDLWVNFVVDNFKDCDVQPLFYNMIQIINEVAELFPGPRYLFVRVKFIKWLEYLSQTTGVFIPVAPLILDMVEYKFTKEGEKQEQEQEEKVEYLTTVKVPKNWLKSKYFQDRCIYTAVDMLDLHFCQWGSHISFPELATIPLMRLKKFNETNTMVGTQRLVKCLIHKVELSIKFVQKKRDETGFSPNDHQAIETFVQIEKQNRNAPYAQYYQNIVEKALGTKQVK